MKTLEEARVISPEDKELLLRAKSAIHQLLPNATIMLYGSVARGSQEAESDYDLYVLTDGELTTKEEDAVWDALFDIDLDTSKVISAQFCSRTDWEHHSHMPFHIEVARDGIVL